MERWEPRRLDGEEKVACRGLWEQIFTEDSAAFLDYYDRWKLAENECWGIFCGGRLASMLQLNPYRMRVRGRTVESRYIVAVATAPAVRRTRSAWLASHSRTSLNNSYSREVMRSLAVRMVFSSSFNSGVM